MLRRLLWRDRYAAHMTLSELSTVRPQYGPSRVAVAFDASALLSVRTGVGQAVDMVQRSLQARDDISLMPYACSFRGALPDSVARLPLPAAVAHRLWARSQWPTMDHWFKDAEVVHGTNYVVPPSHKARLVTVYDCWFLRYPEQANANVVRAGAALRAAVRAGATVHVPSHVTAQNARELLQTDRVEVIALGALPTIHVAPDTFDDRNLGGLAELAGQPFIVAIGTLERRKNLPVLIAAFARMADQAPDVLLVIAGAPGDDSNRIALAIDLLPAALRSRIVLLGRVSDEHKSWLLSQAVALAYPSLDEGFGFPLLEAMHHDVPIVASTAGSIPEVAGDAAVLVAPCDIDALGEALLRVINDSELRSALTTAGKQQLQRFSWDETARRLASLYHRLKQERRS